MNNIHGGYATEMGEEKCIVPHELIIEIASKDIPTIQMIDLPGIRESPESLRQATKQLAYHYSSKPEAIILCVVPATSSRLESSQAMGIVQELRRSDRTICVLTKCDEINMAKDVQRKKLVQRLTSRECEHDLACIVGVKNRDTCEEEDDKSNGTDDAEDSLVRRNANVDSDEDDDDDSDYEPGDGEEEDEESKGTDDAEDSLIRGNTDDVDSDEDDDNDSDYEPGDGEEEEDEEVYILDESRNCCIEDVPKPPFGGKFASCFARTSHHFAP
jgi:hypothetical protein